MTMSYAAVWGITMANWQDSMVVTFPNNLHNSSMHGASKALLLLVGLAAFSFSDRTVSPTPPPHSNGDEASAKPFSGLGSEQFGDSHLYNPPAWGGQEDWLSVLESDLERSYEISLHKSRIIALQGLLDGGENVVIPVAEIQTVTLTKEPSGYLFEIQSTDHGHIESLRFGITPDGV
jgi:hypothetical protein